MELYLAAWLHAGGHSTHKAVNGFFAGAFAHNANAQHLSGQCAKAASHFNLVLGAQAGAQGVGVHPGGGHKQVDLRRGSFGHIGGKAKLAHALLEAFVHGHMARK